MGAGVNAAAAACLRRVRDDVSVVVPVRNEAETLSELVPSLRLQHQSPGEIVFVDAGSSDLTADILREQAARDRLTRVVDAGAAYPGRARNAGIRAARCSWVALIDAGTVADPEWLAELTAAAEREPHADVVFGTYEPLIRTFFEKSVALAFVPPAEDVAGRAYRGPTTASMLIRKDAWDSVGGFPEDLRACEDLVFFRRLAAARVRTIRAPRARVRWQVPATPAQVFRRFRTYSLHTLRAGLASQWHTAVLRMYVVAALAASVAVLVHWSALLVPVLGLCTRTARTVRARADIAAALPSSRVLTWITVAALLVWIDVATFAGIVDYIRRRFAGSNP